jgi:hypothetical protein
MDAESEVVGLQIGLPAILITTTASGNRLETQNSTYDQVTETSTDSVNNFEESIVWLLKNFAKCF